MHKYINSSLLFLIIQNIFLAVETVPYMNMISDLQMERADVWTTPFLKFKSIISYILGFAAVLYFYLKYLVDNASVFEAAVFGFILYFVADITIFVFFKRSTNHIFAYLLDFSLLGFFGFGLSIFIERNYAASLRNSFPLLLSLFIASCILIIFTFTAYTENKKKSIMI